MMDNFYEEQWGKVMFLCLHFFQVIWEGETPLSYSWIIPNFDLLLPKAFQPKSIFQSP